MKKSNFMKYYVNFHVENYKGIYTDKTGLLDQCTLSLNEMCQKLTCTMHTNFI